MNLKIDSKNKNKIYNRLIKKIKIKIKIKKKREEKERKKKRTYQRG